MTVANMPNSPDVLVAQSFWDFSLSFYALPAVQNACLELQDEHGADVNFVLFILFQANRGQALTAQEVSNIDEEVRAWRETVIQPLRKLRKTLKQPISPIKSDVQVRLREQIKQLELNTEKLEQEFLETLSFITPPASASKLPEVKLDIAAANFKHYADSLGLAIDNPAINVLMQQFSTRLES
jgi:uncharacterized protein (TIGR02444 family)